MFRKVIIIVLMSTISSTSLSAAVNFPNSLEIEPLINKPVYSDNCSSHEHCEID